MPDDAVPEHPGYRIEFQFFDRKQMKEIVELLREHNIAHHYYSGDSGHGAAFLSIATSRNYRGIDCLERLIRFIDMRKQQVPCIKGFSLGS